jgi:gamma-glutamyltranspeptidase/glutathione hydrolase
MQKVFTPGGKLVRSGETVYMRNLADTLTYLAENGIREFYEGEIAQRLVKDCQDSGGLFNIRRPKELSGY